MKDAALIDIGCNLTARSLYSRHREVIAAAQLAGVATQIITGSDLRSSELALQLADNYPQLYATAGCHPHHADAWNTARDGVSIQMLARAKNVVAVGEMGLDYWRKLASPVAQRNCFVAQLEIAALLNKPVFLHERQAFADFIAIVTAAIGDLKAAVWHCFTGNGAQLEQALELGLYIGITGWICDPQRGKDLRQIAKIIPNDRLMIESDAPYLSPKTLAVVPRINEPQYLPEVLRVLAQVRSQEVSELAQCTSANARRFFALQ